MSESASVLSKFLLEFPITSRWISDIIRVLTTQARGTAHVSKIASALWDEHPVKTREQTITRRINDYCSDAYDFKKSDAHDLFERVKPATYRLRSYPKTPDIFELIPAHFQDEAMESMWKLYTGRAEKEQPERWNSLSNQERLERFAKWMAPGSNPREHYERLRAAFASSAEP